MATIAQILIRKFRGRQWSIEEDDYSTLTFADEGPVLTEAEIRVHDAEITALIADEEENRRLTAEIVHEPGRLFAALDIVATALIDLTDSLKPEALARPVDKKRLKGLKRVLDQIKGR